MKNHKNICQSYKSLYKNLIGAKSLCIRFDKIDGFISIYDRARYLVLFGCEKNELIYNSARYLIEVKSGMWYKVCYFS